MEKKESEKNENKKFDTGFGELLESIKDRKTQKIFADMTDFGVGEKEKKGK
jgi:hypothetical protein